MKRKLYEAYVRDMADLCRQLRNDGATTEETLACFRDAATAAGLFDEIKAFADKHEGELVASAKKPDGDT